MKTAILFLSIFLIACSSSPQTPAYVSGETKSFEITAKQFAFEPALITVNKGDEVRLFITGADVEHGISIPAFHASAIIPAGKVTELDFVADKAGMFEFRCSVPCGEGHQQMTGAIEVVEATQ